MPNNAVNHQLLIGADPELFVREKSTGKIVSAHDLIPGTKLEPYRVKAGAIQVDGVAAEFNIDPCSSGKEFYSNVTAVMEQLKFHLGPKYELVIEPYTTFDKAYFNGLPDTTKELGCNPDFNAYTGQVNPAPDRGENETLCTASGHIHAGWTKDINPHSQLHFEDCQVVIKELDYYIGLYTLLWDKDHVRRSLYGKAGAFRPKPYGVEYRTPSSAWLRDGGLASWVANTTLICVNRLLTNTHMNIFDKFGEYAREQIDSNNTEWLNTDMGKKVHAHIGNSLPNLSFMSGTNAKRHAVFDESILNKILNQAPTTLVS